MRLAGDRHSERRQAGPGGWKSRCLPITRPAFGSWESMLSLLQGLSKGGLFPRSLSIVAMSATAASGKGSKVPLPVPGTWTRSDHCFARNSCTLALKGPF
jgi:hypothetical protein